MSSDLKTKSARANGAKSHGPTTPEGRAISSRNSLTHGLSAQSVVLSAESTEDFQTLLDAHIHQFHPANHVEMELVRVMVIARWRLRRILAIETSLLANELVRRAEDIDDEFSEMTDVSPGFSNGLPTMDRASPCSPATKEHSVAHSAKGAARTKASLGMINRAALRFARVL